MPSTVSRRKLYEYGDKSPFLLLLKPLDRESQEKHVLTFTAIDGGNPPKSGSLNITVSVLDVNDNRPVCNRDTYTISLKENASPGFTVTFVNATDPDEGVNGEVEYTYGRNVQREVHDIFDLDKVTGEIRVKGKIDFEENEIFSLNIMASDKGLNLKTAVENPLEIHYVAVEVTDINDNHPSFSEQNQHFEIAENSDEEKIPFLVLKKPLDREHKSEHLLILKALDGGNPPKSGTLNITVTVLDSNDNRPVFSQDTYSVSLQENSPIGTTVIKINASDSDEGPNSEIEYALGKTLKRKVYDIFQLDRITGEIKVKGAIDFEDTDVYKLDVQASDKGQPPLSAQGRVIINIQDINDNMPEIELTSLSNIVAEDCKPGTVIALISVSDKDSGVNGKVVCSLSKNVPFELKHSFQDNMYSLVTKGRLDRELVPHYDITITATDLGQPPLSSITTLSIQVADVNDNQPEFSSNFLELYIFENNAPGASIFSVRASDKDVNENALISYQINRGGVTQNDMTSFLNINSETGVIYSLKTFDFEAVKTFQFQVVATDSGTPSLSSNVTVNVFILDQNDNVPVILYPVSANGSAEAYDADIGYNGWLLFSLQEVSDHSLFSLDRYTGQIRTLRSFTETDEAQHKLLILVKDNGNVSLSATATVIVKVVEPKEAFAATDVKNAVKDEEENNVTFYLIITLGSVSVLFVISIIVLIAMQCSKSTDYSSKYLQDTNYDGTMCHSIQYRSGDKRYMLVGPRMSIGSTLVPGSNGNTLVIPDRRRRDSGEVSEF
uniref:Cadherin domain-containing protein n=1 Tax=Sinocyclocheilus grahami TaxID=75366 RepID=A0A672SAJ8_SINGR